MNVASLVGDLELLGLLFESLVIRDLRVLTQPLDARLFHYRDKSGLDVDAVVELSDRSWVGVEVKLGQGRIDEGAATLKRLANVVDTTRSGRASALVVVTAQGFGYRRDDGVYVVPLGALAP